MAGAPALFCFPAGIQGSARVLTRLWFHTLRGHCGFFRTLIGKLISKRYYIASCPQGTHVLLDECAKHSYPAWCMAQIIKIKYLLSEWQQSFKGPVKMHRHRALKSLHHQLSSCSGLHPGLSRMPHLLCYRENNISTQLGMLLAAYLAVLSG